MKTKKIIRQAGAIISLLLILSVMGCDDGAANLETRDFYGEDAGGSTKSTTFLFENSGTTTYMTLCYLRGERGTYANNVFTPAEDFTWTLKESTITIEYYTEATDKIWANRVKETKTFTGALTDGVPTITNSENQTYEAAADLVGNEILVIQSYVEDRQYENSEDVVKLTFGSTSGNFNDTNFKWEISDSKMKIYLVHEEGGTYDIIKWIDGSGYHVVDQDDNEYTYNDIPLVIKDEDITKANLIGTWVRNDGGETIYLTSANYGSYWSIDAEYELTVNNFDFYITYNNDDAYEEVQIGINSQYYTSRNAIITNLYNKD
ncbi:MAG: hypothetical protein JEZ04_04725 [Spirochaetales bacterium]|nr:hypothetical protein [Spirochaetales bacterium]